VFAAVLVGCALYYTLGPLGLAGGITRAFPGMHIGFPIPTLDFLKEWRRHSNIADCAPFGLLTVIGGINVTESARVAGDNFDTREILLAEAISTLVAGVCGGVAQVDAIYRSARFQQMEAVPDIRC